LTTRAHGQLFLSGHPGANSRNSPLTTAQDESPQG
jgi:hypothetical protein